MKMPRISISRLMGLVLVSALGLVGLMRPDPVWASLTFTAAVVVLSVAVLNVIYSPGSSRPFWVGFSVAGWISWMVTFGYPPTEEPGPPSMIPAKAIERLWGWLHPAPPGTRLSVTYTIAADGSMVPSWTQFVATITPPPLTLPSPLALIPPPVIPQPIDPPVPPDMPAEAAPVAKAATAASDPSMTSTAAAAAAAAEAMAASGPSTPSAAAAAAAVAEAMAASGPSTPSAAVASPSAGPVAIATMPIAPPPFAITPFTTTAPGASDWYSFSRIGQSLATLLAALLGGCYADFAAGRKKRIATSAAEVSPSSP